MLTFIRQSSWAPRASPVTSRTVGDRLHGVDVVLLHQLLPFRRLVVAPRRPIHIEDLIARPDALGRVAMTIQTPFHVQRRDVPHQRHLIHATVAGRTADAFVDVNTVVEIDEVGQVVYARPYDRLAGPEALAHRLQKRAVGEKLRVAIHTGRGRREAGERRGLDRRMAVPAVYPVVARR